jgi:hypothetical protein
MSDARFLARRSEDGYVNTPALALPGEPEAISADEQTRLTEATARQTRQNRIAARTATAEDIQREIDWLDARGRYLRRQLGRLKRAV